MDTSRFYGRTANRGSNGRTKDHDSNDSMDTESTDDDYSPDMSQDDDTDDSISSAIIESSSSGEETESGTGASVPTQSDWRCVQSRPRSFSFTGKEEVVIFPKNDPATGRPSPIDVYNLFITDELLDLIVTETNKYAQQVIDGVQLTRRSRLHAWKGTSRDEIRKFIGLLIYMGLIPKPEISLYWSKSKLYVDRLVPEILTREKFELLLRFIHFSDNACAFPQQDKLHKIRPLINIFNKQYQATYMPGSDLIIDESMVPFRGRVGIRQYLPGKSHKYGIKLYKLCSVDGYTWNFIVHTGQSIEIQGLNATESLTVKLSEKLLNNGATIFADNYYCSAVLAEFLLNKKTYLCGTIRANRKYLCKEVMQAKLKKKEMKCQENIHGVKLYNWKDKRNVHMISTVPEHGDALMPCGKTNREGEEILKPECVLAYNKAKKGVDISDQLTSYYTPLRKSKKWYRKLAIELIAGTSVVNACVLYNKYFSDKPMNLRHFRDSLVLSLTGSATEILKPGRAASTVAGKRSQHSLEELAGPKKNTRKRCRGCYEKLSLNEGFQIARNKARRVSTFCEQCDGKPHLCIPCFAEKHDE